MLSPEILGVAIAFVLWIALLASPARSHARQPLVFLVLHLALIGIDSQIAKDSPAHRDIRFAALLLLLASIGRSSVVLVLEVALGRRRALPKIVRDLVQGVVYIGIFFGTLRTAGVEPGSILTTSALLTAAIALSLQETLGNLVAGLAIQIQRPFDEGDWIQFDTEAKHIGKVLEINWRATKVLTLDDVEVIVPNATLAKAPITNFTKPHAHSRRSLYVQVPANVPPARVQRAILEALPGSFGVLAEPAPSVVTNLFTEGNVEYWVRFFTDRFDKRDGVDGAARDRIWSAFSRAGIPFASPSRWIHVHEVSLETRAKEDEAHLTKRERTLESVDFLSPLSVEQRRLIALRGREHWYSDGEPVVRQGDTGTALYVVQSGEVIVERNQSVIARLGPGHFFGEMALMTGEPRNATVRAAEPSVLFEIDSGAMRDVLEKAPELAEHMSRVIATRQAKLETASSNEGDVAETVDRRSSVLLGRIRKFFAL